MLQEFEFEVDKENLTKRSAIFSKILTGNWKESLTKRISVISTSVASMNWICKFISHGISSVNPANLSTKQIVEVMKFSHLYQLVDGEDKLFDSLLIYLLKIDLSINDCFNLLNEICSIYPNIDSLQIYCLRTICCFKSTLIDDFLKSNYFLQLNLSTLKKFLKEDFAIGKQGELYVVFATCKWTKANYIDIEERKEVFYDHIFPLLRIFSINPKEIIRFIKPMLTCSMYVEIIEETMLIENKQFSRPSKSLFEMIEYGVYCSNCNQQLNSLILKGIIPNECSCHKKQCFNLIDAQNWFLAHKLKTQPNCGSQEGCLIQKHSFVWKGEDQKLYQRILNDLF